MKFINFFRHLFSGEDKKNKSELKESDENTKVEKVIRESERVTKSRQVKNHLIINGSITSWEAIKLYGATRLSSIIFNLREKGYNIESVKKSGIDRNRNRCNYVVYKYTKKDI